MKTGLAVTAILIGLTAGADVQQDPNKKDLDAMQGDWAAVSSVRDGQKLPDDEAQILFRTVKGNEYTVFHFDRPIGRGTFTIDATKNPKAIDATPATPGGKGQALLGIYEIKGNRYTVCFAAPGKERPTQFTSKADSGWVLTVWEREKK